MWAAKKIATHFLVLKTAWGRKGQQGAFIGRVRRLSAADMRYLRESWRNLLLAFSLPIRQTPALQCQRGLWYEFACPEDFPVEGKCYCSGREVKCWGIRTSEGETEVQCCVLQDVRERPGAEHCPIW